MPDVPPNGVWLVVGGPPPSDEAGCDGGGASVYDAKVYAIPIKCSIPQQRRNSRETKGECTYKRERHTYRDHSKVFHGASHIVVVVVVIVVWGLI